MMTMQSLSNPLGKMGGIYPRNPLVIPLKTPSQSYPHTPSGFAPRLAGGLTQGNELKNGTSRAFEAANDLASKPRFPSAWLPTVRNARCHDGKK